MILNSNYKIYLITDVFKNCLYGCIILNFNLLVFAFLVFVIL